MDPLLQLARNWHILLKNQSCSHKSLMHAKMRIGLDSTNKDLAGVFASFIKMTVLNCRGVAKESKVTGYNLKRWTVLSSPFAHKKARTQFEKRTYQRIIDVATESHDLNKTLIWYFWRNAPPSINMNINV